MARNFNAERRQRGLKIIASKCEWSFNQLLSNLGEECPAARPAEQVAIA
jgi:hypothetical protein